MAGTWSGTGSAGSCLDAAVPEGVTEPTFGRGRVKELERLVQLLTHEASHSAKQGW